MPLIQLDTSCDISDHKAQGAAPELSVKNFCARIRTLFRH